MELVLKDVGGTRRLDLGDGTYVAGRDYGADIRVSGLETSHRHARIRIDGERLFVTDLESQNGTGVNGIRLEPGREVEVSAAGTINLALASLTRGAGADRNGTVSSHDLVSSHSYFDERGGLVGVSPENFGEMLSSLFGLIAMDGLSEGFEDRACKFVSRWITCDRTVLLLDYGPGTMPEAWGSWTAEDESIDDIVLSRSIVDDVVEGRASLLLAHPSQFKDGKADSLHDAHLSTAMAVPLFDNERVRGILYADSTDQNVEFSRRDLEILTATANAVAVKLSSRDLERELSIATRIQRRMCPAAVPAVPGYEVSARLESCYAVGGDFYHVGVPVNGKVLIALGDVAGKGLSAALAQAACSVLIPALDGFCDCPCTLVNRLHESLLPKLLKEQYVTLFLGELDLASGDLRYVNAGHPEPFLLRKDGRVDHLATTGGFIGMFPEYSCRGAEIRLEPGDLLVVFSDGVTDATLDGDCFFEREAAEKVIIDHCDRVLPEITNILYTKITAFLRGGHASDDTTLLMLRRRVEN